MVRLNTPCSKAMPCKYCGNYVAEPTCIHGSTAPHTYQHWNEQYPVDAGYETLACRGPNKNTTKEPFLAHKDERWILWAISTIHDLRKEVTRLKEESQQLVAQVKDKSDDLEATENSEHGWAELYIVSQEVIKKTKLELGSAIIDRDAARICHTRSAVEADSYRNALARVKALVPKWREDQEEITSRGYPPPGYSDFGTCADSLEAALEGEE